MERFSLRKLNYVGDNSIRFAALENSDGNVDISNGCESVKKVMQISAKESLGCCKLKQHKPWFDEERLQLLDESKQAKLQ